MSSNVSDLLQKCLDAYDAGFSPQDCLSAFPRERNELEPLLRQALSLRVAFAHAPSEAFQQRTRERLLFGAGREISQAFATEPRPEFVDNARQRLIEAAGATAQEALRSVPPPRMPFWWNARRRLLEAAAVPARPQHTPRPAIFALRAGLSAAVVVFAITVAGVAYMTSQSQPTSVSAEIDALEQQLNEVEHKTAVGEYVAPSVLKDLSRRTSDLAQRLEDQQAPASEKLPALVKRQKDVLSQAAPSGAAPPELVQAQQQLNQAERTLAQLPATPATTSSSASTAPTAAPTATSAPAIVLPAPQPGQVVVGPLPSDTTYAMSWNEVRTTNVRFVIPSTWRVTNVTPLTPNVATLNSHLIGVDGGGAPVVINLITGEIAASIGNQPVALRAANGSVIPIDDLVARAGPNALAYRHILDSFRITNVTQPGPIQPAPVPPAAVPPSPTNTPVSSPTPAATNTPPATSTPAPTATPQPSATAVRTGN